MATLYTQQSSNIRKTWLLMTGFLVGIIALGFALSYIYGNPNIGSQGTTSYTVGSLSSGKKYYFVVKAINGCTPGSFSNEVSTIAGESVVNTPTPEQTPTIDTSSKTNSQNIIVSTDTDTPTPPLCIQPTTGILPTQPSLADNSKSNMLLIISVIILVIGSIGNVLYWKYKKNELI